MIATLVALGLLLGQQPVSASRSQPAAVPYASITVIAEDVSSGAGIDGVAVTITPASPSSQTVIVKGTTFAGGKTEFPDLAPGRYIVTASSSDLLAARPAGIGAPRGPVTLKPGAHEVMTFGFTRRSAIRGQVLTPAGRPVQGATVEVVTTKSEFRGRPVIEAGAGSSTDADGRFSIEKLVPGRYLVRARLPGSDGAPLNFVYAPHTTTSSQATPVTLGSGAEVGVDITALAVPAVEVGGQVVDVDGNPVQNATISLASLEEDAIPVAYFGPRGPHVSAGIKPLQSVRTDRSGRFVISGVREGLYALQAVVRGQGLLAPVVAAGVAEVDVGVRRIDSLTVTLQRCARMTGRLLFNGLETPDAEQSVIVMKPEGEDAHLRKGLAATTTSLPDGTFAIDGLLGQYRLTVRPSGNWFTVAATLENGTDVANGPIDFEPGRSYENVRVRMSDETAEIEGLMPEGWKEDSHSMVIVFPDDVSLGQENQRYVRSAHVTPQTRRFSVQRLPPGRLYLVALYPFFEDPDPRAASKSLLEIWNELWPRATRIFIGEAGKYEVTLPPLPRDR